MGDVVNFVPRKPKQQISANSNNTNISQQVIDILDTITAKVEAGELQFISLFVTYGRGNSTIVSLSAQNQGNPMFVTEPMVDTMYNHGETMVEASLDLEQYLTEN